eukprot:scaffold37146_cov67-Phaeocystis_antarctica.AAC.7
MGREARAEWFDRSADTCWRLGSVDGGTLSSTESDRSATIDRELISRSRSSSSSIHNGPLVVRSCTEAPALLGGFNSCASAISEMPVLLLALHI